MRQELTDAEFVHFAAYYELKGKREREEMDKHLREEREAKKKKVGKDHQSRHNRLKKNDSQCRFSTASKSFPQSFPQAAPTDVTDRKIVRRVVSA